MASKRPQHDTLRERGEGSPRIFRFLVAADRAVIALLFLLSVPAALLLGAFVHPIPFDFALVERAPIQGLYQALVISTVTGATLVLTLSQLVLSEEFGAVGEHRQRMEEAVSFRRDVEELAPDVSRPPTPARLLEALLNAIVDRCEDLSEIASSVEDPDLREEVDAYLERLHRDVWLTTTKLDSTSFGSFETVDAVFSFDVSAMLHGTGRLRSMVDPSSTPQFRSALEDIEDLLEVFGSARAHVKALYFQYELADLSRWIIYTSFPAIVVAVASLLFFDPTAIDSGWAALTIASVTVSIALTPFAILLSYILRVVKVTQSTFSRSPFLIREG